MPSHYLFREGQPPLSLPIQIGILVLILLYIHFHDPETSLIFLLLSVDSLFSAVSFLRQNFRHIDLTQSQTLSHIQLYPIYRPCISKRYLYYALLHLLYMFLRPLFWFYQPILMLIYFSITMSTTPYLLNRITRYPLFRQVSNRLEREWERVLVSWIARQVAFLINLVSRACVNLRPEVQAEELLPLFQDLNRSLSFFYHFLGSFLIATLIHYTKSTGNRVYARLIRLFYNYKTGDHIGGINDKKAREKFTQVIVHRQWDRLLLPDIHQSFFYIYKTNQRSDVIQRAMNWIHYKVLRIGSIWSISAFLYHAGVGIGVSTGLEIWRRIRKKLREQESLTSITSLSDSMEDSSQNQGHHHVKIRSQYNPDGRQGGFWYRNQDLIGELLVRATTLLLSIVLYPQSFLLLTLLAELGWPLGSNPVSRSLYCYIKVKSLILARIQFSNNRLNWFLFSTWLWVTLNMHLLFPSSYLSSYSSHENGHWVLACDGFGVNICLWQLLRHVYLVTGLMLFGVNGGNRTKLYWLVGVWILGYFSDHNPLHLMYIMGLTYTLVNWLHHFFPALVNDYTSTYSLTTDTASHLSSPHNTYTHNIKPSPRTQHHEHNVQVFQSYYAKSHQRQERMGLVQRSRSRRGGSDHPIVRKLDKSLPMFLNDDLSRSYYIPRSSKDQKEVERSLSRSEHLL